MTEPSEAPRRFWRSWTYWRRVLPDLLQAPIFGILGWILAQGIEHDLPWVSVASVLAAVCMLVSWYLSIFRPR